MVTFRKGLVYSFIIIIYFLLCGMNNYIIQANSTDYKIYIDSIGGSDSNDGVSSITPLKSINQAFTLLESQELSQEDEVTFCFLNNIEFDKNANLIKHNYNVIFMGNTQEVQLNLKSDIVLTGNTTFTNITIVSDYEGTEPIKLFANGYTLIMGKGISTITNGLNYLDIIGSSNIDLDGKVDLSIFSGKYHGIFGNGAGLFTGNININIYGGEITNVIAGTNSGKVVGNVNISIEKDNEELILPKVGSTDASTDGIYGGGVSGEIDGNTNLILSKNTIVNTCIYGGGCLSTANVSGTSSLMINDNVSFGSSNSYPYSAGKYGSVKKAKFIVNGDISGTGVVFGSGFASGSLYGTIGIEGNDDYSIVAVENIINGKVTDKRLTYFGSRGSINNPANIYGSIRSIIGSTDLSEFIGSTLAAYYAGGAICNIYGDIYLSVMGETTLGTLYGAGGGNSSKQILFEGSTYLKLGDLNKESRIFVNSNVFAGGQYLHMIGNTNVEINEGSTINGKLYGGCYGSTAITTLDGSTNIVINGGTIATKYVLGGNYSTTKGGSNITFSGGDIPKEYTNNVSGIVTFNINLINDLHLNSSYIIKSLNVQSGILTLGEGVNIVITDSFTGKLKWNIDKNTQSEFIQAPVSVEESSCEYVGEGTPVFEKSTSNAVWGFIKKITVKFINIDFDYANIYVYKNYKPDGNPMPIGSDGTILIGVGLYCISLRNITESRMYTEYNWTYNFTVEKMEQAKNGIYEIDCFHGFRTNNEWEDEDPITIYNDEILDGPRSVNNLLNFKQCDFSSPALERFYEGTYQQYTTDEEIYDFLCNMIDNPDIFSYSKYMYIYIAGYSEAFHYPVYAVIFSTANLKGMSFEQAIEKAKDDALKNNKLRVFHTAQSHGSEHADSDGALAFIYQLAKGSYADGVTSKFSNMEDVFNKATFIITPRNCPDGASIVQRYQQIHQIDPNRDRIVLQNNESINLNNIYYKFLPEFVITGHELYGDNLTENGIQRYDVSVKGGYFGNYGSEIAAYVDSQLIPNTIEYCRYQGLNMYQYARTTSMLYETDYYCYTGAIAALIEMRGTGIGLETYDRRVYSYLVTAKAMCDKLINDANTFTYDEDLANKYYKCTDTTIDGYYDLRQSKSVIDMVAKRREQLINGLDTYVTYAIQSGTLSYVDAPDKNGYGNGGLYYYDGTVQTVPSATFQSMNFYDKAQQVLNLPKGYFIDACVFNSTSKIPGFDCSLKDIFDNHYITYYYVSNLNDYINVKQIHVTSFDTFPLGLASSHAYKTGVNIVSEVSEQSIDTTFINGAYYIPVNQLSGLVAVNLLEQNIKNNLRSDTSLANNQRIAYETSLFGAGYVTVDKNNNLPIYRYYDDYLLNTNYVTICTNTNNNINDISSPIYIYQNQEYSLTNLVMKVVKVDGSTEIVPITKDMITNYDSSQLGKHLLEVVDSKNNYFGNFNIYVVDNLPQSKDIIYVSNIGNDLNDGLYATNPVQSLYKAHELLLKANSDGHGTIIIMDNAYYSDMYRKLPSHTGLVIITSVRESAGSVISYLDDNTKLNITRNLNLNGPTLFKNICITNSISTASRAICAQGNNLVIGENVETFAMNNYYPSICGGFYEGDHTADTNIEINSGDWRNVYGGNYRGGLVGNIKLTIFGGNFLNTCYGGFYEEGSYKGNIEFYIYGGNFVCSAYGGANHGDVEGNVTMFIDGGTFNKYAGAKCNSGKISGTALVYPMNEKINISSFKGQLMRYNDYKLVLLQEKLSSFNDVTIDCFYQLVEMYRLALSIDANSTEASIAISKVKSYVDEYNNLIRNYNSQVDNACKTINGLIVKEKSNIVVKLNIRNIKVVIKKEDWMAF